MLSRIVASRILKVEDLVNRSRGEWGYCEPAMARIQIQVASNLAMCSHWGRTVGDMATWLITSGLGFSLVSWFLRRPTNKASLVVAYSRNGVTRNSTSFKPSQRFMMSSIPRHTTRRVTSSLSSSSACSRPQLDKGLSNGTNPAKSFLNSTP
uniref:SFRICE_006192 n=1 Tax=Spodoptera frugiperda TaxID=7108 RepID=A0A2H1W214_SPOFR